jgi:hypothetical protein
MSHLSMILTGLMLMAMVAFMAPNIFAFNRGYILRNVALWLAIFLGLAVIYQTFGPGSPHPLFELPSGMAGMRPSPAQPAPPAENANKEKDDGGQDFTPPKE